jgi:peptidase E
MMKLVLTAAGFSNQKIIDEFLKMVGKPVQEIKVLFIPTASRTEEELKYVEIAKKELYDIGVQKNNLTTFNLDKEITRNELGVDAIYVCGGNTFYLLHKLRKTGFDKTIKEMARKGVVYVGVSAGSVIAGPTIITAQGFDENDVGLDDFTGLKLTNKVIIPHAEHKGKGKIEDLKKKVKHGTVPLTDNQALLINNSETRIIQAPPK